MKMITLWEPYASAIALGYKRYETRSWTTNYRGIIGIHASKKKTGELRQRVDYLADWFPDEFSYLYYDDLPFGCVVAACRLVACHRAEDVRNKIPELEFALGDYSDGRYAWELELVKLPDKPIPAVGKQGLWNWEGAE